MGDVIQMWRKVRGVVLRRGVAPQDADDILQEAFARLESYTRMHELRSQEAFLVTAALNISRDQARRRANSPLQAGELDLEAIADSAPQPEEQLRMRERMRRANSGLARLDPLTRRCLLAQRLEGLTFPQVAEREGMSVAAVEKRVARAVMFLTQWMDEE
ncbi:sigma-70 family RNA polymerase sigma factor [Pseudoxanthomonas sp. PXM04]|uniref:RNA polymerase sigma factor n=1 Tax=Pseudoxanthomonas sp. PXM04 TaxID=2769297 RepID=UPI001CE0A2AD|nr:sigma-70 family RNA polymerase sigma factor [Pseudoxanthomonas sp. PXM04]